VTRRVLAFVASAFVAAVIVASFTIMQSPGTARLKKADATRSDDLALIRNAVRDYYKNEGHLPDGLAPLVDRLDSSRLRDPITQAPYTYRVLDAANFELCARFALDSRAEAGPRYLGSSDEAAFGIHGAGDTCFRLTATPPTIVR
jgi:hypothetical protein